MKRRLATPLVNGFIFASEVYHDLYRWPVLDRRAFEQWCDGTAWGQLFMRYARMGPQGQPPAEPARVTTASASARIH